MSSSSFETILLGSAYRELPSNLKKVYASHPAEARPAVLEQRVVAACKQVAGIADFAVGRLTLLALLTEAVSSILIVTVSPLTLYYSKSCTRRPRRDPRGLSTC